MSRKSPLPPLVNWTRHRHGWEKIPLEARLAMVRRLRETPLPWGATLVALAAQHSIDQALVRSLGNSLTLYGFDDPFITGQRSLDEPEEVERLRKLAEQRFHESVKRQRAARKVSAKAS